jgi:hypothetical protein
MAQTRINWKSAFDSLLGSRALTPKDRDVIESMHARWSRGKSMTAGRKRYFLIIQERTERAAEALREREQGNGQTAMGNRLQALRGRMGEGSTWDHGYVESVATQEAIGRTLSARQIEILEKIESNWTEEKCVARTTFVSDYESNKDGMKDNYARVLAYYAANPPYNRGEVSRHRSDPDGYVPDVDTYNKVMGNKYAQKVLRGYESPAKYPVGSLVFAGSKMPYNASMHMSKGAFVLDTDGEIISASKGNKMYTLLPIGGSVPIKAEERNLKSRK